MCSSTSIAGFHPSFSGILSLHTKAALDIQLLGQSFLVVFFYSAKFSPEGLSDDPNLWVHTEMTHLWPLHVLTFSTRGLGPLLFKAMPPRTNLDFLKFQMMNGVSVSVRLIWSVTKTNFKDTYNYISVKLVLSASIVQVLVTNSVKKMSNGKMREGYFFWYYHGILCHRSVFFKKFNMYFL